jgi:hypothetical protein
MPPASAFSRLDAADPQDGEERQQLNVSSLGETSSAVRGSGETAPLTYSSSAVSDGDEGSPLSLSLDGSCPGSDDSNDESGSTWTPRLVRVSSPQVVRTHSSQRGSVCRCVHPRWWSYMMLVLGVGVVALAVVDAYFIYRQYADGERFVGSTLMWASVGFSLGLSVCCGLCVATHGGTGMISLILRDNGIIQPQPPS